MSPPNNAARTPHARQAVSSPSNPATGAETGEDVMTAPTTAIPATREELLDPEWLAWALDDVGPDDRIVRVERTDSTKTRAEKLRFVVTVESEAGRQVHFYCAKAYLDG